MRASLPRGRTLVALPVAAAIALPAAAAAFPTEPVVAGPRVDLQPAVASGYLAYSQSVRGHADRFNLFVKPEGEPRFRVNPAGTNAFVGSIDGTTLAYGQRRRSAPTGDIVLYDLVARTRSIPPGVNTGRHETHPMLSGDWLAFTRSRIRAYTSPRRLLLRNLVTEEERELDFGDDAYVQGGGMAGNYVAWTRCPRLNRCATWLYEIDTESRTRLPKPGARSQFAATVTEDGTVYYAESSTISCGPRKVVRFWRQPLTGTRELLAALPRGKDTASTSALVHDDGSVDLYFDRFNGTCTKADVYRVSVPAPS